MNILTKTTQLVHYLALPYLSKEDVAVDATCGNGNDTLFLAENCRYVYGFDVQKSAVSITENLLKSNELDNYCLINDGHQNIDQYVKERCAVILFNLGYLPKGDKNITTLAYTTLIAVEKCLNLLKLNGLMIITIYCGHQNGKEEKKQLLDYLLSVDENKFMIRKIENLHKEKNPPEIIVITRKSA
ncbi:MAG: class I SAM-dependent methyltransferase [Erysipelotrichia bacterium]|nr:class I SAM-dependent methyltransferase [Erysipelotrichia bacterium]